MSIFSASGDDGAQDCFPGNPTPQVDDPASQPFVTGVGGTRVNALGPRPSETVWNNGPTVGASGGGISTIWKMPAYQTEAPASLHVINAASSGAPCGAASGNCREVPDVSADADPNTGYVIYWNGSGSAGPLVPAGWQVVGGTSGAAPAWAALIALTNASSPCSGTAVGFANPALYNAAASAYAARFQRHHDRRQRHDRTPTAAMFAAGPGYDMATGLGTPERLVRWPAPCAPTRSPCQPRGAALHAAQPGQPPDPGLDTRGASRSFQRHRPAPGLSMGTSNGKITGRPSHLGTSTVTIAASDPAGTTAHLVRLDDPDQPHALARVLVRGRRGRPRLSFMLAAGRDAPKLKTVTLTLPRGLRFTRSRAKVNVTGRGGRRLRYTVSLQHGALVLKLKTARQQVHVTVTYPRLQAGGSLVSRPGAPPRLAPRAHGPGDRCAQATTRLTAKVKPRS